jgi:hypothetical protein
MFFWPNLELTEYEKRFVGMYKTDEKPGVLRRSYKVLLNSQPFPTVPGLETVHLEGAIQIARRSRVFALTFAGDVHAWHLSIATASGETLTPQFAGGPVPMVSSLAPGQMWNVLATDFNAPSNNLALNDTVSGQIAQNMLPMLVEPNWELSPNEQLIFRGTNETLGLVLEIGVHAWEFPGMVIGAAGDRCAPPARMGGGPSLPAQRAKKKKPKK